MKRPAHIHFVVKVQRSVNPPDGIMIYDAQKLFTHIAWHKEEVKEIVEAIDDMMPGAQKIYVWAHVVGDKLCLDFDRPLPLQTQVW